MDTNAQLPSGFMGGFGQTDTRLAAGRARRERSEASLQYRVPWGRDLNPFFAPPSTTHHQVPEKICAEPDRKQRFIDAQSTGADFFGAFGAKDAKLQMARERQERIEQSLPRAETAERNQADGGQSSSLTERKRQLWLQDHIQEFSQGPSMMDQFGIADPRKTATIEQYQARQQAAAQFGKENQMWMNAPRAKATYVGSGFSCLNQGFSNCSLR
jgi:hypothetical protein